MHDGRRREKEIRLERSHKKIIPTTTVYYYYYPFARITHIDLPLCVLAMSLSAGRVANGFLLCPPIGRYIETREEGSLACDSDARRARGPRAAISLMSFSLYIYDI